MTDNRRWGRPERDNATFRKIVDTMQTCRGEEYLRWQVVEYTKSSFMIRPHTHN